MSKILFLLPIVSTLSVTGLLVVDKSMYTGRNGQWSFARILVSGRSSLTVLSGIVATNWWNNTILRLSIDHKSIAITRTVARMSQIEDQEVEPQLTNFWSEPLNGRRTGPRVRVGRRCVRVAKAVQPVYRIRLASS